MFQLLLLFFVALPPLFVKAASPVNLSARWNITHPTYAYNKLNFLLDYEVNDFIDDSMTSFSLWDSGCKEGGGNVEGTGLTGYFVGDGTSSLTRPGTGLGTRFIKLSLHVHTPQVELTSMFHDTTPLYPAELNMTAQREAMISFCVRFSLNTPGDYPTEVNFHEVLIDMAIDFSDGFAIDSVDVNEFAMNATQSKEVAEYTVHAWNCSPNSTTGVQGSVFSICVEPDSAAFGHGLFMRSIDAFTYILQEGGFTTVTQDAVQGGEPSGNGLTRLFCVRGQRMCRIETILNAYFYASEHGIVDGYGQGTMQFGSRSGDDEADARRLLLLLDSPPAAAAGETAMTRDLQESAAPGPSDIYVQIEVDGSPPIASSWWFESPNDASIAPIDIAIYILFVLCVFSLTLLFMQQPRFKETKFYL